MIEKRLGLPRGIMNFFMPTTARSATVVEATPARTLIIDV